MAWMVREDQLDPDQRDFINVESKKTGNIWVKGFAGSGKSVLLVHALREVIQKNPSAKVAIVVYTCSLVDLFKTGMKELGLPNSIPVMTYVDFYNKKNQRFDYIFCDEVQDLTNRVLVAMKDGANKVIVAGDSNQSIYDRDPKWYESVVKPSDIGKILNAKAFSLNRIYRLPRSIIRAVQKIAPFMFGGSKRDLTKVDVKIRVCEAQNITDEVKYVYNEAIKGPAVNETSVILIPIHYSIVQFVNEVLQVNNKPKWIPQRKNLYYVCIDFSNEQKAQNIISKKIFERQNKKSHIGYFATKSAAEKECERLKSNGIDFELKEKTIGYDYDSMNKYLREQNVKLQYVGNSHGSLLEAEQNKEAVLMTYHSSKGLDFNNVFLPFQADPGYSYVNKYELLFIVAITRSRKNLYLTYSGHANYLIDEIKDECTQISISNIPDSNNSIDDFDF